MEQKVPETTLSSGSWRVVVQRRASPEGDDGTEGTRDDAQFWVVALLFGLAQINGVKKWYICGAC